MDSIKDNPITKLKVLATILTLADKDGNFNFQENDLTDLFGLDLGGLEIEAFLHDLSSQEIISFTCGGEDGFAANFWGTISDKTREYYLTAGFADLFKMKEVLKAEIEALKKEKEEILSFDIDRMSNEISKARIQANKVYGGIKEDEMLNSLQKPLENFISYLDEINNINESYLKIYKNIIKPIQKEGQRGIKTTVKWAVLTIIVSTIISLIITNFSYVKELSLNLLSRFI